jgi:hypothetical protein
MQFV